MDNLGGQVWVLLAVIAFAGVLAVLHCIGAAVQDAADLHDLKARCAKVREEQLARMKAARERASFDTVERQPRKEAA